MLLEYIYTDQIGFFFADQLLDDLQQVEICFDLINLALRYEYEELLC